jgi:hypothetical protein
VSKEDVIAGLNLLEGGLKQLSKLLVSVKGTVVSRLDIRNTAQQAARKWFEDVEKPAIHLGVSELVATKYHNLFDKLLDLSVKVSWRETYIKTVSDILEDFRTELLTPVLRSAGKIVAFSNIDKIMENVSKEEADYLTEAIECAKHGYLRASAILAWNAAVHRMHRVIEKRGFDEFNKKSEEMKALNEGRFKRFGKSFKVNSLSELRATVFDNDLLWVLEYWGLIDSNEHDRLSLCFTMRNNCAHPGEAPLTEENLASIFSDLNVIIFHNPDFEA